MRAQLTPSSGPAKPVSMRSGQRVVIGRGLDAGVRIEDDGVSRSHAALALISERLYLTDLASRHGTFLGQTRVLPQLPVLVLSGSEIQIGPCTFRVELTPEPDNKPWAEEQLRRVMEIVPEEKYEILGKLGGGSLGRVWAAKRIADEELVAIKVLRVELEPDSEAHQRFLREARLLAQLDSPYVVEFLGTGSELGKPYMVTELVHGPSLKDRLEEGPLAIPDALRIGEHVARALHALSGANIIHRDVKPQNILVNPGGAAKLTDFGVAKSLEHPREGDFTTGKGWGLGTLAYLAPEQLTDAASVDARADLYGLGATLYHLLAGRAPLFHEDSDTSLDVKETLQGTPEPLRALRPDCPQPVSAIVQGLLAAAPEHRLQPAEHVAGELASVRQALYPDSDKKLGDTATRGWKLPGRSD